MARKRDHYEPKSQYPLMLPSTIAVWLEIYGEGSISLGIVELVRRTTDVDSLYPEALRKEFPYLPQVAASHEVRKADADHGARWAEGTDRAPRVLKVGANRQPSETEDERRARIKRNTEIAVEAQQAVHRERARREAESAAFIAKRDFDRNVKAYMDLNQAAYDEGAPLQDHVFLLAGNESDLRVYEEVLKRSKAKFGWSKGPKPADVSAPHYRAVGAPQAAPVSKAARDPLEPPGGRVTVDYSDVFDAPLPRREPDPESLERETAVRVNEGGELEPIAAEVKPLSTAVQNSTADPGAIGPDETPEPSF